MRKISMVVGVTLLVLLVGCAGFTKLTPREKALTSCDELMTQYESFYAQSVSLVASETTSPETKKFVVTVINPKLNQVKPLIMEYCEVAITGQMPPVDRISAIIADITTLFASTKKGTK